MNYLKSFKNTDILENTLGTMDAKVIGLRFDFEIFMTKFNGVVEGHLTCIEFDYQFIRALAERLIDDNGNEYETEEEFIDNDMSLYTQAFIFLGCSKEQYDKLVKYLRYNLDKRVVYITKIPNYTDEIIFRDIILKIKEEINPKYDILLNSKLPYLDAFVIRYLNDIGLETTIFDSSIYLCNNLIED